jgi:LmbE family N-acetylglucosaminyl deacetylase
MPTSAPPSTDDLDVPARALAIVAHPDDAEFNCGATLAKWSASGCEVSLMLCTDGSKGTWDPDMAAADLIPIRQAEQRRAADELGCTGELVFAGWTDGELEVDLARRSVVARTIRELTPDVVLAHDPWRRWRLHPDHRAAGFLACDGIVGARDPHFFPEHGLPHHRPSTLLLFESEEPDHVEDVSGHGGAKVGALLAHESQFETTMGIGEDASTATGERADFRQRILGELADTGKPVGVRQAEAFKRVDRL